MRIALVGVALFAAIVAAPVDARAEREALVVLGSGLGVDGAFGPRGIARMERALAFARARPEVAVVVVTGGKVTSDAAEGPAMAAWLIARGLARDRIRIEANARHTGENADFVAPILARERITVATIVTDRGHLRRASWHLRAALAEQNIEGVEVRGAPVDEGRRGWRRLRAGFVEWKKLRRDRAFRRESARGGDGRVGRPGRPIRWHGRRAAGR